MRLLILAVGHSRGTSEGALTEDFVGRAHAFGKRLGFSSVAVEEIAVSKLREAKSRIGAGGEQLRDAGARALAFLTGAPAGLDPGPAIKSSRSLAFGPQTWPHLLVRAMLAEQI